MGQPILCSLANGYKDTTPIAGRKKRTQSLPYMELWAGLVGRWLTGWALVIMHYSRTGVCMYWRFKQRIQLVLFLHGVCLPPNLLQYIEKHQSPLSSRRLAEVEAWSLSRGPPLNLPIPPQTHTTHTRLSLVERRRGQYVTAVTSPGEADRRPTRSGQRDGEGAWWEDVGRWRGCLHVCWQAHRLCPTANTSCRPISSDLGYTMNSNILMDVYQS